MDIAPALYSWYPDRRRDRQIPVNPSREAAVGSCLAISVLAVFTIGLLAAAIAFGILAWKSSNNCPVPQSALPRYTQECPVGYEIAPTGGYCKDNDECLDSKCSHDCSNTPGSYRCLCSDGYQLQTDRRTCVIPDLPAGFTEYPYARFVNLPSATSLCAGCDGLAGCQKMCSLNVTCVGVMFSFANQRCYLMDASTLTVDCLVMKVTSGHHAATNQKICDDQTSYLAHENDFGEAP
ncbi:hypothetical protein CAPTEDRAFT_196605 [Capitella teleta]|uniref:EGF-like domain-containing protein n=1 Tax=Capitella teleta TaxID=283909 RepID=R7UFR7_CAPTE|nr:hypothetical protein CAPTEDRAFT_196605 [Capitella teleta]|eukprot:ELU02122.1 hypothetical protein CAPTEDRAFT_196605 [Capitella teleta]